MGNNNNFFPGYAPYGYDQIQTIDGQRFPSSVKNRSYTYAFWERALFQRAASIVDFELPEEWNGTVRDFFYFCLFRFGYLCVFYNKKFGYSWQPCTLGGYDFYYQPTKAIVANPKLSNTYKIGNGEGDNSTCEIIKLTPDFRGIWDIISYYAEKLSTMDGAVNMAIINSKLGYVLGAKTKASAEALKKILDKLNNGESTVIADMLLKNDPQSKENPFTAFERGNLKNSYITTDLLKDFQTVLNNFDSEIGIPTIPYEKKERMVTDEANMRMIDGVSRSAVWKATLESSLEIVNKHFGQYGTIKANFKFDDIMEGGPDNERVQNDSDRSGDLSADNK